MLLVVIILEVLLFWKKKKFGQVIAQKYVAKSGRCSWVSSLPVRLHCIYKVLLGGRTLICLNKTCRYSKNSTDKLCCRMRQLRSGCHFVNSGRTRVLSVAAKVYVFMIHKTLSCLSISTSLTYLHVWAADKFYSFFLLPGKRQKFCSLCVYRPSHDVCKIKSQ